MNIKVKPMTLPFIGRVNQVSMMIQNFSVLATTCEVNYNLYDDGKQVFNGKLQMDEEAFAAWGQDNTYVIDWVLEKLSFEKEEVIEETN